MSTALKLPRTLGEFLAWEEGQPERYEFLGPGRLRLMAGGTGRHNVITLNVVVALRARLRGGPCGVRAADLKVRTPLGRATYPDVFVVCGSREPGETVVDDPVVIVEVLSPKTEQFDRGEKRELYKAIPSLRHHVLVSQDEAIVEITSRIPDGLWSEPTPVRGLYAALRLDALGVELPLAEVYADVELDSVG